MSNNTSEQQGAGVLPGPVSEIDADQVDAALATTRSVRLRLDFEREVDNEIILDCIDIAEQAPTGGNQGSRRWIVVRDPAVKKQLADLYMDAAGKWMVESRDRIAGTDHPNAKVMASAAHLAENLEQCPAIVIPTIIGRHDNSGRPGLFDSVIQSVWSFCVALRARGLGTAYTTAILSREDDLNEILGITEQMTPIAMIPVAWTKGTSFRPAPRYPARQITYFDAFTRTYASGPSTPVTMADGPGTVAEIDIKAPVTAVWPHVVDINLPAQFSEEFQGAEWTNGSTGPEVGAQFLGRNKHPAIGEWEVVSHVVACQEPTVFAWNSSDADNPGAQWRFELEAIAGATRLRFSVTLGPGPSGTTAAIDSMPDKEARIIDRRLGEINANMTRVVEGIRDAVIGS